MMQRRRGSPAFASMPALAIGAGRFGFELGEILKVVDALLVKLHQLGALWLAPGPHLRGAEDIDCAGQAHDPIGIVAGICAKRLLDTKHTTLDGRH